MTSSTDDSVFEFPCDFPIKVMGKSHPEFADTVVLVIQKFDDGFHGGRIETRPSSGGNYIGLTCTVRAVSREQLDDIYRALSSHPMVSVVM
jgi:uncharacterized protein